MENNGVVDGHVGLLNCELVRVPSDYDNLKGLPQRIQKLSGDEKLCIAQHLRVSTLPQLDVLVHDRQETILVHHICAPHLGHEYPKRLVTKTLSAFRRHDEAEWRRSALTLCGGSIATEIFHWHFAGNFGSFIPIATIGFIGAAASWILGRYTLAAVERGLRRLAFPRHPPSRT